MKTTSQAYRDQMALASRNTSLVRVTFSIVDADISSDGTYDDNGHAAWSDWSTMDTGYLPTATYGTLEENRLILDGTMLEVPDAGPYNLEGFVGSEVSGADCTYSTAPLIWREFSIKHNITGIALTFDSITGDHPVSVIIRFYRDGTLINQITSTVTSSTLAIERKIISFDKFSIEFGNSNVPYRRARLQSIVYGTEEIFDNIQIEKTEQTQDIDPISRRLPTETMSFTLFDYERAYDPENPSGFWEYIDAGSPVSIQYGLTLDTGDVYWLEPDNYLLDGRPTIGKNRATFKATRLISTMNGTYFKGTFGTQTLYDLAEAVLLDADLPLTSALENPWVIDASLNSISTTAAIPIDTHKNCLQMIAHAGKCRLYTDADGIIRLEAYATPSETLDYTLDFSAMFEEPQITKIDPLYSINVRKYTYTPEASSSELHKSTFTVDGSAEFYAEFEPATDITFNITGGSLSDTVAYGRAATATITATGEVTVTVSGKRIATTMSGSPYIATSDTRGIKEIVENPLVTDDATKSLLETHLADYLSYRLSYNIDYRGSPELEAGDLIEVQSAFTDSFPAIALKHSITFNGAIRGSGIFKGIWFKAYFYDYTGEISAGDILGVI